MQLNRQGIEPYLGDSTVRNKASVYTCPATAQADGFLVPNASCHEMGYSYFGQSQLFNPAILSASASGALTRDKLESNRLVLCDILYYWAGGGVWYANHYGSSYHISGYQVLPPFSTNNRAYGDGRVEKWSRARFDLTLYPANGPTAGGNYVRTSSNTDSCIW